MTVPGGAGSSAPRRLVHVHEDRIDEHDAVADEIRGWFIRPTAEIGIEVDALWCGYLNRHPATNPRLFLTVDDPSLVTRALDEVGALCAGGSFDVHVDDRDRAASLDNALRESGLERGNAVTYLALVGDVLGRRGPADLEIIEVAGTALETWASVKIKCFADDESPPAAERIADEVHLRRSEAAEASYVQARLGDEDVAVLAFYRGGQDEVVFNLGTRLPWRHRGIAQTLLRHWVELPRSGCRSLIINADDAGRPSELYRRMGFRDEIYWYQRYRSLPSS